MRPGDIRRQRQLLIVEAIDAPSHIKRLFNLEGAEDGKRVRQDFPKNLPALRRVESVAARRGGAKLNANGFSERLALLEELTKTALIGELQGDREPFAPAAGKIEQTFGLLRVFRGWLLHEDVNGGFESLARELVVAIRRRANMHDIHITLVEAFAEARKGQRPWEPSR